MDNNHATMDASTTSILDLPNELIDQILAEVKWGAQTPAFELDGLQFYENLTKNTKSIQNIRLTCRRFASRAIPLLLPVASASISNPSSIDRLEEIADNAAFAPHVKAVRVCFEFYESRLAEDIDKLPWHLIKLWTRPMSSDSLPMSGDLVTWRRALRDWQLFRRAIETYGIENGPRWPHEPPLGDEQLESMRLLKAEHTEYRKRYEAQQRLGKDVLQRIAQAMARMPQATGLILDDGPDTPRPVDGKWLATPTNWAAAFKHHRSSPPIETLFELPAAISAAGVKLTALRIHRLRLPSTFPLWLPTNNRRTDLPLVNWWDPDWVIDPPPEPHQALALRDACRTLRVVEFTPGYEPGSSQFGSPTYLKWPNMSWPRIKLYQTLDWLLSSATHPTHVSLDLRIVHSSDPHTTAAPTNPNCSFDGDPFHISMPNGRWWPHIRVLCLRNGWVALPRMMEFLVDTAGTLEELRLEGMELCAWERPGGGHAHSWLEVLDKLREHCRALRSGELGGREGRELVVKLRRVHGAEFEDPLVSKRDMAEVRGLFDEEYRGSGMSRAESYIQGVYEFNPLVELGATKLFYSPPY